MPMDTYLKLQNGSDIRGVALEGVPGEQVNLTPTAAGNLARAFVCWLSKTAGGPLEQLTVSVGSDPRLSGPKLKVAVAQAISELGARVADCGLASTPAMFMSTKLKGYEYDGAVMLTASHLPFNRNGLKFFTPTGGLEKEQITELCRIAGEGAFTPAAVAGPIFPAPELMADYAAHLVEKVRAGADDPADYQHPLKGLKIVVDAGNGSGGFFASEVLAPLGADTRGSRFLEPDGSFPNHIPNPDNEQAMRSICEATAQSGADLGIIFDTDVDRAGAVDASGREINRNRIIALMASIVLEEHPGTVIVTDSVTSDELVAFITALGGVHHRFKRGYRNVINEAIRLNSAGQECCLAIETSGHGALKENYFLDDGAYLISKILIKAARLKREGQTIDRLLTGLREPLETQEFRMKISAADFKAYGSGVLRELESYAARQPSFRIAPDNYEGLRVSFGSGEGDGWLLLRMSLHDPLMPLNIESRVQGGVSAIGEKLYRFLTRFEELDSSPLAEYLRH
ncbi:MAG: phosphomannomutase/phosphoglucomutase [Clostridia bacterium]|nr:phosphomannomutase/phosphoglucomutase [Clostridia bacterium]